MNKLYLRDGKEVIIREASKENPPHYQSLNGAITIEKLVMSF